MTQPHPDDTEPQNTFYDDNPFHEPSIVVDARAFSDSWGDDEESAKRPSCSKCKHYSLEEVGDDISEPRQFFDHCLLGFYETGSLLEELPSNILDCAHFCSHYEPIERQEYAPCEPTKEEMFSDIEF